MAYSARWRRVRGRVRHGTSVGLDRWNLAGGSDRGDRVGSSDVRVDAPSLRSGDEAARRETFFDRFTIALHDSVSRGV